jgi:outer membrane protein assembly factor BamB
LLFLPLSKGILVALQSRDGKLLWQTDPGGEFSASPATDSRRVYVASSESTSIVGKTPLPVKGVIRALGLQSGVTIWRLQLPTPLRGTLVATSRAVFGAGDDGKIYALDKDSGRILWATHLGGTFTSHPVVADKYIYLGNDLGILFALDTISGKLLWRYRTRGALRGTASHSGQILYIGSADNYVYALNRESGRLLWRSRTGAEVQAVAVSRNGLIVASLDNFIYFLSFGRGDRLWKRQMPGRVTAAPLVAENSALFIPLAGDSCIALNLSDGKVLNNVTVGEDNNTAAAPIASDTLLFITTRRGLIAFENDSDKLIAQQIHKYHF